MYKTKLTLNSFKFYIYVRNNVLITVATTVVVTAVSATMSKERYMKYTKLNEKANVFIGVHGRLLAVHQFLFGKLAFFSINAKNECERKIKRT